MNSLGFDKDPAQTRVVVAMSGGVDSSVVAAMLTDQGYDVVGITLQLYDQGADVSCRTKSCCAGRDIQDARMVAEKIGIPYYVLDYESNFKESVIDDFADSYLRGETPIPCVRCNQTVKFRDLLETARDLDADCLATGHYVQRKSGRAGAEMHRAADPGRDQSYFLFTTTPDQLDYLRFPLGHLHSKAQTRALAERYDLVVADKPDSQDICFVPDGNYAGLVGKLRPEAHDPGEIVHVLTGQVLGRHRGLIHYTVGQRRGLGIGGTQEPLYVIKLEPKSNHVLVGPKSELARINVYLDDVNWLDTDRPLQTRHGQEVSVKLRSAMTPIRAEIFADGPKNGARLRLFEPHFGVAPGQAGVMYQGERVLGGGWIRTTA